MVNEFNSARTTAELRIDAILGAHTDAVIATHFSATEQNISNSQLLHALIVQMFDRIETLESP